MVHESSAHVVIQPSGNSRSPVVHAVHLESMGLMVKQPPGSSRFNCSFVSTPPRGWVGGVLSNRWYPPSGALREPRARDGRDGHRRGAEGRRVRPVLDRVDPSFGVDIIRPLRRGLWSAMDGGGGGPGYGANAHSSHTCICPKKEREEGTLVCASGDRRHPPARGEGSVGEKAVFDSHGSAAVSRCAVSAPAKALGETTEDTSGTRPTPVSCSVWDASGARPGRVHSHVFLHHHGQSFLPEWRIRSEVHSTQGKMLRRALRARLRRAIGIRSTVEHSRAREKSRRGLAPQRALRTGVLTVFFGSFFAVGPCSWGVSAQRGRRWNERKSARPNVTTGHTLACAARAKSAAFGGNPHVHQRDSNETRWGRVDQELPGQRGPTSLVRDSLANESPTRLVGGSLANESPTRLVGDSLARVSGTRPDQTRPIILAPHRGSAQSGAAPPREECEGGTSADVGGPDVGRTIEFKATGADRTRTGRGQC
eukprot:gene12234-biopygen15481